MSQPLYLQNGNNSTYLTGLVQKLSELIFSKHLEIVPTGGSDSKASAYNAGDPDSIPGMGRSPGEGNAWKTLHNWKTPELLPGKSHGQRSLVGYSPWGHNESDMTEQLHFTK